MPAAKGTRARWRQLRLISSGRSAAVARSLGRRDAIKTLPDVEKVAWRVMPTAREPMPLIIAAHADDDAGAHASGALTFSIFLPGFVAQQRETKTFQGPPDDA